MFKCGRLGCPYVFKSKEELRQHLVVFHSVDREEEKIFKL